MAFNLNQTPGNDPKEDNLNTKKYMLDILGLSQVSLILENNKQKMGLLFFTPDKLEITQNTGMV